MLGSRQEWGVRATSPLFGARTKKLSRQQKNGWNTSASDFPSEFLTYSIDVLKFAPDQTNITSAHHDTNIQQMRMQSRIDMTTVRTVIKLRHAQAHSHAKGLVESGRMRGYARGLHGHKRLRGRACQSRLANVLYRRSNYRWWGCNCRMKLTDRSAGIEL